MLSRILTLVCAGLVFSQSAWAVSLENPAPGSIKSGVGVVSGWICDADELEVSFNQGARQFVPYGSERTDTASVCGDTDNGFGLLINYNNLGDGPHTVTLYADGEVATHVQFNVRTLGTDFLRGLTGQGSVELSDGRHVALQWQETIQGFTITDYNYTGTFPGMDQDNTPAVCEQDPLPEEYYGDCGSVRWSCANGLRVHRQDTETHYRWACRVSICGETAECEEEKPVEPGIEQFNGEWQFVFHFGSPCRDELAWRFLCTITDGSITCRETERRQLVNGQVDTYTLTLSADVTLSGNVAGEMTIKGSDRIADGTVVAWIEGSRIGFGSWGQTAADQCGGTWSADRR